MRIVVIAMVVLFGFGSLVQADPPKRGPQGDRPDREEMRKKFMEKFDTNKNGKIDDEEKAAIREAFAKRREAAGDKKGGDKKDGDKKGCDRAKKGCPDGHKGHGSAHGKKGHHHKGHHGHHAKKGHGKRDGDRDDDDDDDDDDDERRGKRGRDRD
jgi:hypothetical protein